MTNRYLEPTSNITEFLRETLKSDKVKFMKEFIGTSNEVNYKFDPTTAILPDEIQYQCPLICAAIFYNAVKCFELIAEKGAKMTASDSWLCGAVHMAARCGRLNILTSTQCENLNFASPDWRGRQPIHFAAEHSHLECLKFLVETKNADINAKDKFGMTPFHVACEKGNLDIISYLLEKGAEIIEDNIGRSPIDIASEKGQIEVLRNFASKNQTIITHCNSKGQNAAHYAAKSGFEEEIEFLTTIPDFDFNKLDDFGMAPLHYAAEHNSCSVISSLLPISGINKNIATKDENNTPLHIAAFYGKTEAAAALISPNPDANNSTNAKKETPLHSAAVNGHYYTVSGLMTSALDPNAVDATGKSPREAAHGCYAKNIVDLLNGKKQNLGNLCEPEPYQRPAGAPQQAQPAQQQQQQQAGSGCQIA